MIKIIKIFIHDKVNCIQLHSVTCKPNRMPKYNLKRISKRLKSNNPTIDVSICYETLRPKQRLTIKTRNVHKSKH